MLHDVQRWPRVEKSEFRGLGRATQLGASPSLYFCMSTEYWLLALVGSQHRQASIVYSTPSIAIVPTPRNQTLGSGYEQGMELAPAQSAGWQGVTAKVSRLTLNLYACKPGLASDRLWSR
jgi:hypothetical protein